MKHDTIKKSGYPLKDTPEKMFSPFKYKINNCLYVDTFFALLSHIQEYKATHVLKLNFYFYFLLSVHSLTFYLLTTGISLLLLRLPNLPSLLYKFSVLILYFFYVLSPWNR